MTLSKVLSDAMKRRGAGHDRSVERRFGQRERERERREREKFY